MCRYPVKDDHTNPATPTICDSQLFSLYECPPKTTCNCTFDLFGLVCLTYDCHPKDSVSCPGSEGSFCSTDAPVCDIEGRVCRSEDGDYVTEMLQKSVATKVDAAVRGVSMKAGDQAQAILHAE